SQRQAGDRRHREARAAPQRTSGVAQVGKQVIQPADSPGIVGVFADLRRPTQFAMCLPHCVGARAAALIQFFDTRLDMALQFIVQPFMKSPDPYQVLNSPPHFLSIRHKPLLFYAVFITIWIAFTSLLNSLASLFSCLRPLSVRR